MTPVRPPERSAMQAARMSMKFMRPLPSPIWGAMASWSTAHTSGSTKDLLRGFWVA